MGWTKLTESESGIFDICRINGSVLPEYIQRDRNPGNTNNSFKHLLLQISPFPIPAPVTRLKSNLQIRNLTDLWFWLTACMNLNTPGFFNGAKRFFFCIFMRVQGTGKIKSTMSNVKTLSSQEPYCTIQLSTQSIQTRKSVSPKTFLLSLVSWETCGSLKHPYITI